MEVIGVLVAIVMFIAQLMLVYAVWQIMKSMQSIELTLRGQREPGAGYDAWHDKTEP